MNLDGDWSGQQVFDFHPDWEFNKDYGAVEPPPPPASKQRGDSAVAFWSWPWVLPAGGKQPEWGFELLRYYLAEEYQLNVHPKFKELVVRQSTLDDDRLWWPAVQVARDIVKGSRKLTTVMPMNPVAAEYSNLLAEAFDRVLNLTETPEEAMARVKDETMKAMAASA
jgi:maltose-binding protein MalE